MFVLTIGTAQCRKLSKMIYHPHATNIIAEMLGDSARISGGSLTNAGAAAARVEKQVAGGNFDGDVKS